MKCLILLAFAAAAQCSVIRAPEETLRPAESKHHYPVQFIPPVANPAYPLGYLYPYRAPSVGLYSLGVYPYGVYALNAYPYLNPIHPHTAAAATTPKATTVKPTEAPEDTTADTEASS